MGGHNKEDSPAVSSFKDITAGVFRGISQVIVGHPLDTIKVRLQTQSLTNPTYNGTVDCFRKTIQQEGKIITDYQKITGLYRGASSPVAMAAFYSAILFFAYGQAKRIVQTNGEPLNFKQQLNAGMMTGFMASLVEGPMDLFKCKMQVQKLGIAHDPLHYRNAMDAGVKIFSNYGIRGIYRGVDATILRNVPGSAVYFFVYEMMRQQLGNSQLSILTAGGVGGVMFWCSVYPFDVIKSTLQADSVDKSKRMYDNVFDCAKKMYKTQGPRAFWKGFQACLIRAFPVNACSFLTYEYVRSSLGYYT